MYRSEIHAVIGTPRCNIVIVSITEYLVQENFYDSEAVEQEIQTPVWPTLLKEIGLVKPKSIFRSKRTEM